MYNEELEFLIDSALADGVLTEKERQILFRKALAMGVDLDEFEMVLDARLVKLKKAEQEKAEIARLQTNEHSKGFRALAEKIRNAREKSLDATKKAVASGWIAKAAKGIGDKALQLAEEAEEKKCFFSEETEELATQTAKGISTWVQENETVQDAFRKGRQAFGLVSEKTMSAVHVVGNKFVELKDDEQVVAAWEKTGELVEKLKDTSLKGAKVITGVQAVQARKKTIKTKEEADLLKAEVEATNEAVLNDMNETLDNFGKRRLEALHNTVGVFMDYLNRMNQRSKAKEYEFLTQIDFKKEEIIGLKEVDMSAADAAKMLALGGTSGVLTYLGVSSGAAAAGTVGTAAVGVATYGVGIAVAVIAVCTLASSFYSRKYTEATQYLADLQEWEAQAEASWVVIAGIKQRVLELQNLTNELEERTIAQLHQLDPYVDNFDSNDMTQVQLFQQSAIMVKSMSELAQVTILDEEGNLNEQANLMAAKTEKILNTSL